MRSSSSLAAAVLLVGVGVGTGYMACGDADPPASVDERYDILCPLAGTSCANADGPLLVGVAKRDITPVITETLLDCGMDQLCPGDAGYPGPDAGEGNGDLDGHPTVVNPTPGLGERVDDVNGNGFFDAVWIAGYGNGRPAHGVHDPIWARALVLRKGETTFALVVVDLVGYFYDEVVRIREMLDPALGIDLVLVAATHTHEAPDSIGIWGFDEGTSGVDPAFMDMVRQAIVDSITEAAGGLKEARVFGAVGDSGVHPDATITQTLGINNLIRDGRDPVIIDDDIRVLRFVDAADGTTIGTLVNWQNHPEALCDRNRFISSDFVHYLREAVENGIDRLGVVEPGLGGMAIYVNGAVGGMQSPGRIQIYDLDGSQIMETCHTTNDVNDPFFDRPRAFGELAALDALRVLRDSGEEFTETDLSFATKTFRLPVENWGYHAMFLTEVFYGRRLFDFDRTKQITADNLPHL
ncbi:MAG: neutral/alkaline non-lysosomal ceramidase N-terminal domain-containing protein, partial [Myxococcota bacterium]